VGQSWLACEESARARALAITAITLQDGAGEFGRKEGGGKRRDVWLHDAVSIHPWVRTGERLHHTAHRVLEVSMGLHTVQATYYFSGQCVMCAICDHVCNVCNVWPGTYVRVPVCTKPHGDTCAHGHTETHSTFARRPTNVDLQQYSCFLCVGGGGWRG